jgi:hypothetical protein
MAHAPKCLGAWTSPVLSAKTYEQARNHEGGRDTTDESYLLPAVDPVFLDGHGRFRPWNEIAKIIREKAFGEVNVSA